MASPVKKQVADEQEAFFELPRKLGQAGCAYPAIAACEADGRIEMTAEIPGVPVGDVDISLDGNVLTITVEKRDRNKGKQALFSEQAFGRFARSIQLPFAPDPDSIGASVEDGLLTISLPRVERGRKRHIVINGAHPEPREDDRGAFVYGWADLPEPEPAPPPRPQKDGPMTLDVKATRID